MGNRWVNRAERAEIIAELGKLLDVMTRTDDLPMEELLEVDALLLEWERLTRIHRAQEDVLYFAHAYFGECENPGNDGNWIPSPIGEAPEFHRELCGLLSEIAVEAPNKKVCWAAPRGHAKSSYLAKTFPLHQLCYRQRRYIMIISETPDVSTANLAWINHQLKHNRKLRQDFGPLLAPIKQRNPQDNVTAFITWEPKEDEDMGDGAGGSDNMLGKLVGAGKATGKTVGRPTSKPTSKRLLTKVEAASTGEALRGRNWNAIRPDLIICDDLEGVANTSTPQIRQKLKDWFAQYVMPLGDPAGAKTAFLYMGTTVHSDSLLLYVMQEYRDFTSRLYRAVIRYPDRMDLWETCRQIYKNRDNPDCVREAEEFYTAHKEEMDAGAIVLWEQVKPIWELMTWRWNRGSKAFNTEFQNEPIDEETQVFVPERFFYWSDAEPGKEFDHAQYEIFFGIDFAMGKQRGDYSALVVIAKHSETGAIYVVDCFIERVHPDRFMDEIVERVLTWQPLGIAAEAQMAQEFFVHKLKEALRDEGYPVNTRVHEIHQRTRKELRIESLLPDIENTTIRFSRRHGTLLDMFERYGTGYHDDGPDALEMAVSISRLSRKKTTRTRKHIY
ncbi:phage terminase large subunit [Brevibacillus dissolubilis]|uniref:phage terminase large subunit n=1 Tax=Brevibacillus dissolubilis TaxID=1844116 RepID=UPI0021006843|nr:phage terminase large subunit [Brevibacillus dissolubilis]